MAAFDSACTWLCATYQRRDGAALSLDLAFIRVTGSAIGFSQFSYRVLNGGRTPPKALEGNSCSRGRVIAETFRGARKQNRKAIRCQVPGKVQGESISVPRDGAEPSPRRPTVFVRALWTEGLRGS